MLDYLDVCIPFSIGHLRNMHVKVQNLELFSVQATVKHSPAILAQAPLCDAKHIAHLIE